MVRHARFRRPGAGHPANDHGLGLVNAPEAQSPLSTRDTHAVPAPGLPDLDVARVRRWCDERVPAHARDQIRIECDVAPRHLTILECRPPWREDFGPEWTRFPIARLRYTKTSKTWSLLWRDRNLRFHEYDRLAPSPRVDDLLSEIERDPTAIFWG